jgi:hypothetical protein
MIEEINRLVPAPRARPRVRIARRRLVAVVLIVGALAAIWTTRDRWWPLAVSPNPFDSTPAENFPVGAAGITLPVAQAVPGMPAVRVADALSRVKRALEASYLDPHLLVNHDPSALLDLLAPDSAAAVRSQLGTGQYGTALIRLAPGTALAATPRVTGRMSYREVNWDGTSALDVTTNYVVAYAFDRPSGVVVVHAETHWMFPLAGNLRPSSRGMYLGRTSGYWHGMNCARAAHGLTAPVGSVDDQALPDYHDTDPLDAYFDKNRSTGVISGCK